MKEIKNKSYVLYIKGVEAFEKYKIPEVELMETKKFTDKQLANIAKGDMFLLDRQYNQKLWKMLKKIYAKQFKIASICIDSSIANLSFELFDKKQNLHTFKFHTEDSVLDFKVFKTKKEIGRRNITPFFFVDSFTGPGSYSGRGIMRSAQFDNMFTAAREFGNRYAEANGDCSELLNPEVGKKDSDNGCLKDRPGRVKYIEKGKEDSKEEKQDIPHNVFMVSTSPDFKEGTVVYDKNETGDNGFSWNISVKAPDYINYEDDWNIYQNIAGEFVVRNCYRHKSLISAVNFMRPISGSVNSVIIITEEVDTDMIGAVVYTKGMKLISPWVRVDSISDVIKLMTIPLHQHIVVAKKSVWKKLKNNVSEKEQSEMQSKTEEIEKIDDDECTFKFNVSGFTEKDCSLGELADKLDDSEAKRGDNISTKTQIAHDELESTLYNRILGIIMKSSWSVSSSLTLSDKVAMIIHEVEHYKFQKDFEGDEINGLSINPRNPEITKSTFNRRKKCENKANEIIVGNTYILNGNNDLGKYEDTRLYIGQPVLVLQEKPSGLFLVQYCNGQKFGHIPGDNLSPFCKQDNKKPSESMIGGKYILNGSNDIGIDAEIRPYIGKKVVVTKLHKNGLFSIMCNKEGEEKVFNGIAKYNLTPLSKEDSDSTENFDVTFSEISNPKEALTKWLHKRVNYTPECSIPLADKEIASKTVEEVSEYLDNAEYDLVVNKITNDISIYYRHVKIAGRHMFSIPSDFRERLCDLSYLPDLENRFKQFSNIGILQQELLLKSEDKDILESIGELTFAQVLELFIVLADMKGMIKIKDEESGDYYLKHLEKKAELIANDIKMADITDIKISKMGVLLLTASDTVGEFGRDSRNCTWELFANLQEAVDKLKKTNTEEKVYTLLKYQSGANTIFSNIVPRISKASFGHVFEVLLDTDTLFYYRNKLNPNVEEIGLSCKPTNLKKEHNVRLRDKYWEHCAIEILEKDIKTKINIEPLISSQAQGRIKRARPTNMKVEVYPTTTSSEEVEVNPLTNDEVIEKIKRDLTEPAIEPSMDDLLKCSEMPKIKNEFTGVGIVTAVEDVLDTKEEENNELVLIVCPKEKDAYSIICKTKKELDSDESLSNYRVKFINNETQLFGLIKNDLLYINHTLNLTKEQINNVAKMYIPSHTVGLHYKITEDASSNHTVDILFSYSQKSYDELYRTGLKYIAFKDFQDECKK